MAGNVNLVQMSATLIERTALRYTPAGVPVVEVQLQHRSQALEAGMPRELDFPFGAIALGETAQQLAGVQLGGLLELSGFLAPRSRRSARLMVHVTGFTRCSPPAAAAARDD
jgi:primosomal replication protein N